MWVDMNMKRWKFDQVNVKVCHEIAFLESNSILTVDVEVKKTFVF
jgi:hypothetical protein